LEKIKHTSDKILRIQNLHPLVNNGTIQFSRRHHALLEQMRFFPRGKNDDGPDALEMLVQLSQNYSGEACIYIIDRPVY
jgi:predicted phage terminase large subunit-like protein